MVRGSVRDELKNGMKAKNPAKAMTGERVMALSWYAQHGRHL